MEVSVMPDQTAPFKLPPLPWADNALEPIISANTLGFHYGKHHKAYVDKLNELVAGKPLADMPLEQIIRETANKPDQKAVFNNAGQAWNHTFYWNSLRAKSDRKPDTALLSKIEAAFGSLDEMKKQLIDAGLTQFGSGWAWLVSDKGTLKIQKTANAETPLAMGLNPLLTIDVWEHAYYLDYQNRRADYLKAVVDGILNWDFAAQNLARG
jgi:superoxide dismutase, Fe-Mn family